MRLNSGIFIAASQAEPENLSSLNFYRSADGPRPQRVDGRGAFELSNISLVGDALRARDRSRSEGVGSPFPGGTDACPLRQARCPMLQPLLCSLRRIPAWGWMQTELAIFVSIAKVLV